MRPRFYPSLVNDRFGDPCVHVDFLMERRALLFDLGDISALGTRAMLRISDIFVSHAHIDHFIGFDRLLRTLVGRERHVRLHGPAGFIDRVEAKLAAYTWNLAERIAAELTFDVTEVRGDRADRAARFRLGTRFRREEIAPRRCLYGLILDEPSLRLRCAELEHRTPCLAFALEEPKHINIWRNRLDDLGLEVGPWLAALKTAIFEEKPDGTPIEVRLRGGARGTRPLGVLRREIVSVTRGQKIAYVTDAAPTDGNAEAIVALARRADILFIEAMFAGADSARAAERAHLTTLQAGALARAAEVARIVPFHFSPRYAGRGGELAAEVERAFRG